MTGEGYTVEDAYAIIMMFMALRSVWSAPIVYSHMKVGR